MDDLEIIKRIKKGDKESFREIINRYKKVVYNHSRSFLRDDQEAEDAAQEIFINIYNNIKNFRGDSKLSTWIYRITVNTCKNKLKQIKRLKAQISEEAYENEDGELEQRLVNIKDKEEKEPDNLFASESLRSAILKRVDELTEEQKNVIMLRDVDGLSYEEVGRVMKLSVSAVKSKLFRARENLREKLEKDGII
jgi:RNA polymerase sigma-70 factor (ECF subfamily)